MSFQRLRVLFGEEWVGRKAITCGSMGIVTSTNEVPLKQPIMAYSRLVTVSVQPQMSFKTTSPPSQPSSLAGTKARRSTLLHSYSSAFPPWHRKFERAGAIVGHVCSATHFSWWSSFNFITDGILAFESRVWKQKTSSQYCCLWMNMLCRTCDLTFTDAVYRSTAPGESLKRDR